MEDTWTQVKRNVRSLLLASKIGLDPDELQSEHINLLGQPLPLKQLGFKNVMDMVKMMPDVVAVHQRSNGRLYLKGVSDESTRHIQELVTNQRMSKSERNKLMRANRSAVLPSVKRRPPPPLPYHLKSQLCSLLSHGPLNLPDLETHFLYYYHHPLNVFSYGYYSITEMLEAAADFIQIQRGSVLVLKEHVRPRQVHRPATFPFRTGPIKPPAPATVKFVPKTRGTRAQTPAKSPVKGTVKQSPPGSSTAVKPCPEINHTQSDLWKTELSDDGVKQVDAGVKQVDAGVKQVDEGVKQVDAGVKQVDVGVKQVDAGVKQVDEGVKQVDAGVKQVDACVDSCPDEKPGRSEHAPAAAVSDDCKDVETTWDSKIQDKTCGRSAVPLDVIQSQRLKQPTRHAIRQMMAVHVEHIESPGYFYVRFFDTAEAKALKSMMLEMRRCYSCPEMSARYCLPPQFVRLGQVCCVSPSRMWYYRAVIHRIVSPTKVEVYYVDFGNTTVVQSSSLRFLKSCYSDLPAQAVPSSLAGITFTKGSWSAEAIVAFMVLCNDRTMVGALDRYVGDVLQLYLCDTRTEDDVYIHSVLLSQGHGKPCSPVTTAVRCVRVTPGSLYLGMVAIDLPEVELDTSSSELVDMSSSSPVEETIPPLELIDDNDASFHIQGLQPNWFSTPVHGQTPNPSALSSNRCISAILPSPPSSSYALPDVTQTGTPSSVYETPPPSPASRSNSGASAAQVQQLDSNDPDPLDSGTSSILETLSMHTPDLVQGLLPLRTSGFNFPLFATRFIPLHHSPQTASSPSFPTDS